MFYCVIALAIVKRSLLTIYWNSNLEVKKTIFEVSKLFDGNLFLVSNRIFNHLLGFQALSIFLSSSRLGNKGGEWQLTWLKAGF